MGPYPNGPRLVYKLLESYEIFKIWGASVTPWVQQKPGSWRTAVWGRCRLPKCLALPGLYEGRHLCRWSNMYSNIYYQSINQKIFSCIICIRVGHNAAHMFFFSNSCWVFNTARLTFLRILHSQGSPRQDCMNSFQPGSKSTHESHWGDMAYGMLQCVRQYEYAV